MFFSNRTAFQMEIKLTDMSAIMDSVVGDSLQSFSPLSSVLFCNH